jgi:hypothetical protein
VIRSLTQLYRYTPEIFLFTTATFRYTYRATLRRIGQEYIGITLSVLPSVCPSVRLSVQIESDTYIPPEFRSWGGRGNGTSSLTKFVTLNLHLCIPCLFATHLLMMDPNGRSKRMFNIPETESVAVESKFGDWKTFQN